MMSVANEQIKEAFLGLIRLGIGHEAFLMPEIVDWKAVKALADAHGLTAILVDGVGCMPDNKRPEKVELLQWIGEVLQNYEQRYGQYEKAIETLARLYNSHGYKMMVVKGYACSSDWPRPNHRPCGDIDIWQFGKQKEADALLSSEKGITVDTSHHHHTVFDWESFMVENHYDFINVHHHKSNAEIEAILKEQAKDDSQFVELGGEKVYLPSANLHALFLLKHNMMHFASEGISLRQLLDWGFFVEKHGKDVNWEWVDGILDKFGMKQMFNVFNAICVGDLGFDAKSFPHIQFDPQVKDRVLNEILFPEFPNTTPDGLLKRVVFKLRRWKGNAWKHELCYKDSLWSAFWSGVWNHLLKPASI